MKLGFKKVKQFTASDKNKNLPILVVFKLFKHYVVKHLFKVKNTNIGGTSMGVALISLMLNLNKYFPLGYKVCKTCLLRYTKADVFPSSCMYMVFLTLKFL